MTATPWPQPISSTRSPGWTSSASTILRSRSLTCAGSVRRPPSAVQTSITSPLRSSLRPTIETSCRSSRNACDGSPPVVPVLELDGHAGDLRVAVPVVGLVGAAVQREARVALQVARLHRLPHRADRQLAVLERRPRCRRCAASRRCAAWRSSCAGGRRAAPARARRARARRRRIRTRKPWPERCRAARRRVQRDVESDQDVRDGRPPARADRHGAGLARRAGRRRRRARAARALLARSPGPAAGGGDRRVAGRAAAPAAARARRVAAAHRRGDAVRGGGRRRLRLAGRVLARVRARVREPAERVRRRGPARGAERHPLPPAGRAAGPRDAAPRPHRPAGLAPPRPRARAADRGGDAAGRGARRASCGRAWCSCGSRARSRARR